MVHGMESHRYYISISEPGTIEVSILIDQRKSNNPFSLLKRMVYRRLFL